MIYDIRKWNFSTHEYDLYEVPRGTKLTLYTQNMDEIVSCAGCFKDMKYGEGFTSITLHTSIGLGYPVCETCYQFEFKKQEESTSNENNY